MCPRAFAFLRACAANAQANGVRDRQAYKEKVMEPVVGLERGGEGGVGEDEENGEMRDAAVSSIHSYNCASLVLYCHRLATHGTARAVSHLLPASLKQTAFAQTKQAHAASSLHARL